MGKQINQLPTSVALGSTDIMEVEQYYSGNWHSAKLTLLDLKTFCVGGATNNLNNVLTVGNSTSGKDIIITSGDAIIYNSLTATTVPYIDANKKFASSSVTPTELGRLSGVVSPIQAQLNAKQPLATNLTSLSGLTYVSTSFVKMTAAGTFALDTNTYLTGNQTITLSGEASGSGATSIAVTLDNASVIGKVLTGYVSGAGTVAATDTILQAIQKLNGNTAAISGAYVTTVNGASGAISNVALTTGNLSQFAATTSAQLAGVISDEVGTGFLVFNDSPTFTTQILSPVIYGSSASGGTLTLHSTSHATKGTLNIAPSGSVITLGNNVITLNPIATTGASKTFELAIPANTGQTASTEIPNFKVTGNTKTWANGGGATTIATQRWNYFTANTAATSGGGSLTITNSYALYAEAAVASGTTITSNFSAGFAGATTIVSIGESSSNNSAIWMLPSGTGAGVTNYTLMGVGTVNTFLNSPSSAGGLYFYNGANERFKILGAQTSGASVNFTFSAPSNTGQTASTEINGVLYNSYTRTWANGGGATTIATQREQYIKTVTWATSGGGSLTVANGYGVYIEAPTASGVIITNNYALGLAGSLKINDTFNIVFDTTTGTKIGTATSQKLSFWNATPIVQPTTAVAAGTLVSLGGTALTSTDTIDGYTLLQVVKALRNTGLLQ